MNNNIIKEYECTFNSKTNPISKKGKLCIGTIAISFIQHEITRTFIRTKKAEIVLLYLPMEEISYLEKIDTDGIFCKTVQNDEYKFEKFGIRDEILQLLCDRLQLHLSKSLSFNGEGKGQKEEQSNQKQRLMLQNQMNQSSSMRIETYDKEKLKQRKRAELVLAALADFNELSLSLSNDVLDNVDDSDHNIQNNIIGSTVTVTSSCILHRYDTVPNLPSTVTAIDMMKKLWETKKSSREIDYNNHVIKNVELSTNIDSFYKDYLSDDAKYSLGRYLLSKGDSDIEVTPWEQSSSKDNDIKTSTRAIHYVHPVHIPMAPPSATATKQQTVHTFGTYGICIETCTVVNDVPLTDCFHVKDIIFIEPLEEENKIKLNASFQIEFTKSSLWKSIIQFNTNNAFHSFLNGYIKMIQVTQNSDELYFEDDVDATNVTQTSHSSNTSSSSSDMDYSCTTMKQRYKRKNKMSDRSLLIILFIFLSLFLIGIQVIFFMFMKEELQVMKSNHELNTMELIYRQIGMELRDDAESEL